MLKWMICLLFIYYNTNVLAFTRINTNTSSGSILSNTGYSSVGVSHSAQSINCSTHEPNVISMSFLQQISTNPSAFSIHTNNDGTVSVNVPGIPSDCVKNISIESQKVGKTLLLKFKMDIKGDYPGIRSKDKFLACARDKGYLNGENYDVAKINSSHNVVEYPIQIPFDNARNVSRYAIASPTGEDFPHAAKKLNIKYNSWKCADYESLKGNSNNNLLTQNESNLQQTYLKVCNRNELGGLLSFQSKLRGSPLHHAQTLYKAVGKVIETGAIKKSKDLLISLRNQAREFPSDKSNDAEEVDAAGQEYLKTMQQFSDLVITPLKERVDDLLMQRKHLKIRDKASKRKRRKLDKKIAALNKVINSLSKKWSKYKNRIYLPLRKFNLTGLAEDMHMIALESKYQSYVYKGQKKNYKHDQMTRDEAMQKIEDEQNVFVNKTIPNWDDYYAVSQGDTEPIKRRRKELEYKIKSMKSLALSFQKKENEYAQKYCGRSMIGGIKNAPACKQFINTRDARAKWLEKQLARQETVVNSTRYDYAQLTVNYSKYRASQASAVPYSLTANGSGNLDFLYSLGTNPLSSQSGYSNYNMPIGGANYNRQPAVLYPQGNFNQRAYQRGGYGYSAGYAPRLPYAQYTPCPARFVNGCR